LLLSHVTQAVG